MENLINFDDEAKLKIKDSPKRSISPGRHPLIVQNRMSFELNNPFDQFEYRAQHSEDPFEIDCLINRQKADPENNHNRAV